MKMEDSGMVIVDQLMIYIKKTLMKSLVKKKKKKKIKKRRKQMTNKDMFDEAFPQDKQIGGNHYKDFHIQPYEFISKNNLSFFQGNVIKYVCRYMNKNGIQDLEKVIHYCELEIKKLRDMDVKRKRSR